MKDAGGDQAPRVNSFLRAARSDLYKGGDYTGKSSRLIKGRKG